MIHHDHPGAAGTAREYDVLIAGGGPAGLFCAIQCASGGLGVLVLEKNRSAGRKLLISGSGRCNLTHAGGIDDFLPRYGDKGMFVKPALLNFTNNDLMDFFAAHGLSLEEMPGGKMFPVTQDAHDVLKILLDECARLKVVIRFGAPVDDIAVSPSGFVVTAGGGSFVGNCFVLATGGRSYPATGSTGDGYSFAGDLGHTIVPPRPALAPVTVKNHTFGDCTGISIIDAAIALHRGGKKVCTARGDVLFTHRGLSGPGILDLSRSILPGDTLRIGLIGASPGELESLISDAAAHHGRKTVRSVLRGTHVPERLVDAVLRTSGIRPDTAMAQLDRKARRSIVELFTGLPFEVKEPGGYNEAMVTCGGVSTAEIKRSTMESRIVPRLFFAGEVIDVDGDTGGYNIQFAFSSGALAADGILRRYGNAVT